MFKRDVNMSSVVASLIQANVSHNLGATTANAQRDAGAGPFKTLKANNKLLKSIVRRTCPCQQASSNTNIQNLRTIVAKSKISGRTQRRTHEAQSASCDTQSANDNVTHAKKQLEKEQDDSCKPEVRTAGARTAGRLIG